MSMWDHLPIEALLGSKPPDKPRDLTATKTCVAPINGNGPYMAWLSVAGVGAHDERAWQWCRN